jgi:hypothetical protein
MHPISNRLFAAVAALVLCTIPVRAQVFGTNTGTFVDWLPSYAVDSIPFRYPGAYGSGFNAAAPGAVSGFNPVITGNVGMWSSGENYPDGTGYVVQFNAPNPGAINVTAGGMFGNLTNVTRSGNTYSGNLTLKHDNGDPLAGGGEIDLAGASASNPITNFHVVRPGGSVSGMTPTFGGYLNNYTAVRWMNNNNINNNSAPMTAADMLPSGQNLGTNGNSYDDIIRWSNQQANLQKVWVNIPVNADDSFVKTVADKFASGLAPGKQVVVEYGNENWNFAFSHPAWILGQAKADPRLTAGDDFTRTAQEAGLLSAHVMQVFENEFADKSRVAGFLGSQGANQYFVDQEKAAIKNVYGANSVTSLYKYQGISFYPGDNLTSAGTVDSLVSQIYQDLTRQTQYLTNDKADATASGLAEAIYEWSPNGYLTKGGVPQSVVDAFRADPRSRQFTIDEWNAIKSKLGPNDMAMEFSVLGDGWSTQVNPFSPHEPEQQAIDLIAVGNGGAGALAPEPASVGLIGLAGAVLLGRRRR